MSSAPFEEAFLSDSELDSGYVSGAESNRTKASQIFFGKKHLEFVNTQLAKLPPQGLYQETALGLSGLVILDMLSKLDGPIKPEVACIFIDTLHHFDETISLLDRVRANYSNTSFHVYQPRGASTAKQFAAMYGDRYWECDSEGYDFRVKVEPSERAYAELDVAAVLTGRRKSQGGKRGSLAIIEIDDTGLIKVNPLASWSFDQVREYVRENNIPYNELLDLGYKSIGDWHSTQPVLDGEDERAGRWKGTEKTECGIHNPKSRYAAYLREQELLEQQKALETALSKLDPLTISA